MRIAWFCIPAHGHTNPTLGLVKAMTDGGHEVYYFSFELFREQIEGAGAHFISCDGCQLELDNRGSAGKSGMDMASSIALLVSSTLALDEMAADMVKKIQPDLIVSDSVAYWGKLTAIKYGIPYVSSTTTFAFNDASAKYLKRGLLDMVKLLVSMPKINRQLQRLRDHGYPVENVLEIVQNDNATHTIVYTSAYYQPCAGTFSDKYCFIGPTIRPVKTPIAKTGAATVFISLGTIVQNGALLRRCIDALKGTEYQVIVSLGANTLPAEPIPEHIQLYPSVDQIAVLSIADVFITHCGMNSTSEGLYFGVPLVLCPQTSEQVAVARRTEELGAGIRLKSTKKADILDAVNRVLHCPDYKRSAQAISDSFKRSGGVDKAKRFLENIV